MAIHLNLYHEIHRQAERERRDPVKLAGLAAVLFVIGLVFWFSYRHSVVRGVERKHAALRSSWSKVEPQMAQAIENEALFLAQQKSNQALVEWTHERFYWAPLLDHCAAVTPAHVQITHFTGDVAVDKERKKTVGVLLRGVAGGVQPRTAAEDYRRALLEKLGKIYSEVSVVFDANSLEDGMDTVSLDGKTLPTATFRIRVQFNPKAPK